MLTKIIKCIKGLFKTKEFLIDVDIIKIGVENLNGRIYTKEAAEKMVAQFREKMLDHGHFYGEIGYSNTPIIPLTNISHDLVNMWLDDDVLKGTVQVLKTPNGKLLKQIIKNYNNVVFRPFLTGSINADKTVQVDKFISVDVVNKDDDAFKEIL